MPVFLRFTIVALIVVSDQITKIMADRSLELYETIEVLPIFNISLAYNFGAAFSFLNFPGGAQRWFFTAISLVVSIVLTVWLYRLTMREKWMSLAFALILGGAIGNLIDRAVYGYVVDFIQVYYGNSYFPTFNIADAGITCGAILMLWLTFFDKSEELTVKE